MVSKKNKHRLQHKNKASKVVSASLMLHPGSIQTASHGLSSKPTNGPVALSAFMAQAMGCGPCHVKDAAITIQSIQYCISTFRNIHPYSFFQDGAGTAGLLSFTFEHLSISIGESCCVDWYMLLLIPLLAV